MRMRVLNAMALATGLALAGCQQKQGDDHHGDMHAAAQHGAMFASVDHAVAVVYPTKGNSISGTVSFTKEGGGVHVHGTFKGLEPNSTHAIHIHEFGDQSSDDGTAAGSHYNPDGHKHGGPGAGEHHAGDFGNLQADGSGNATLDLTSDDISIAGVKNPVIGRAVVVHAKADDFVTQNPPGNAGGRIGVGVIGVAKAPAAPK